jgi:hypothetical protein
MGQQIKPINKWDFKMEYLMKILSNIHYLNNTTGAEN